MRKTFTQLLLASKDAAIDHTNTTHTSLSTSEDFLKSEVNNTVSYLFNLLREYKLQPPPYTESTVIGQTYYNFRPGFSKLESLTVALGTHTPPLRIIETQEEWDYLQQVPVASGFPTAVYPRRDTYGIYPKPQAVYTMTLMGVWIPLNMTADDYTTGTAAITTGDETVTLAGGAVVTTSMVGRWFAPTTGGIPSQNFYRIASRTDSTHFELDRKVIDATASGLSYLIGESPEIPEELHEFIPYRGTANYYALRRREMTEAQSLLNYFYTGDYNNAERKGHITGGVLAVLKDLKEKGHSNSQIVETAGGDQTPNFFRDGIWSLITS